MTPFLYEGDSVNFALGMERYSVSEFRPHPPGYILFIGIAKIFNVFFQQANYSLILTALIFSIGTVVFLYLLARAMFTPMVAKVSGLIFLFVPFFWFYGDVALTYSGGSCFATAIAFCAYMIFIRLRKERWMVITASTLAVAGGVRQDILMYMFPLVAFAVLANWSGWKAIFKTGFAFVFFFAIWYIPMVWLSGGYAAYSMSTSDQFRYHASEYSMLFGNTPLQHFKMVKDFSLAFIGASVFPLLYVCLYLFLRRSELANVLRDTRFHFLIVWMVPALLFFTVVFIQQPGYTLSILPALYISLGVALVYVTTRFFKPDMVQRIIIVQVLLITVVHGFVFLSKPLLQMGGAVSKPYEEKSWTEIWKTAAYKGVLRHTYNTILLSSKLTECYTSTIPALPYKPEDVVIVAFHRAPWSFSMAMYYLPEYAVYYVQDYKDSVDKVRYGRNHEFVEYVRDSEIQLPSRTKCVIILCEEDAPTHQKLLEQVPLTKVSACGKFPMFLLTEDEFLFRIKNITFSKTSKQESTSGVTTQ